MLWRRFLFACSLAVALFPESLPADEPHPITASEFQTLQQLITPRAGESRWMEIDWHPNIWEARQQAAAEGKPIFIMAGSGGAPAAGC